MNQYSVKKSLIRTFVILGIIFALWLFGYLLALNYSFNGVVEKVVYDVQLDPTITIKGIVYDLWNTHWGQNNELIVEGDSMVKKKGELYIKLFKRNLIKREHHANK